MLIEHVSGALKTAFVHCDMTPLCLVLPHNCNTTTASELGDSKRHALLHLMISTPVLLHFHVIAIKMSPLFI
jgi:hypothetical protein